MTGPGGVGAGEILQRPPRHALHVWPFLKGPAQRWILPDWTAITLGRHIFAWRRLEPAELAHELTHVLQWQRHGMLFPLRYWMASRTAGRGGDRYRDNAFEAEAYAVEAGIRAAGITAFDGT